MAYSLVTVNAGHSPNSVGASGHGYQEHIVARQIKDKLITELKAVGQRVADTTSDASNPSAVLREQVQKCNVFPKNGRLDVSIHLNAGGGTGSEVLYYTEKSLAAKISSAICNVAGWRDRGAKQRKDLYFLKNTNAPAVLIEVCFIDSASDMKTLMAKMDEIIMAIVKAITGKERKVEVVAKKEVPKKIDDVTGHWAESSLKKAMKKGVLTQYDDGSLKPNNPVTRAQLATILDRLGELD